MRITAPAFALTAASLWSPMAVAQPAEYCLDVPEKCRQITLSGDGAALMEFASAMTRLPPVLALVVKFRWGTPEAASVAWAEQDALASMLANCLTCEGVEEVRLSSATPVTLARLAGARTLRPRALWVIGSATWDGTALVEALASGDAFLNLEKLILPGPMNSLAFHALAAWERLPALKSLHIGSGALASAAGVESAEALGRALAGGQIQELSLVNIGMDAAAFEAMFGHDGFGHLARLHIPNNPVGGGDFGATVARLLATAPLRSLDASHASVTDADLAALVTAKRELARFETLTLEGNRITSAGAKALVHGCPFTGLKKLGLIANKLGDEGAEVFGASRCASLRALDGLEGNGIGVRGARALGGNPALDHLHWMSLFGYDDGPQEHEARDALEAARVRRAH